MNYRKVLEEVLGNCCVTGMICGMVIEDTAGFVFMLLGPPPELTRRVPNVGGITAVPGAGVLVHNVRAHEGVLQSWTGGEFRA